MKDAIHLTLRDGGLTLWALLALAATIYSLLFSVWRHLSATRRSVARRDSVAGSQNSGSLPPDTDSSALREIERRFAAFELDEMAWVERRIPFLGVLIGAAPLLGLLGTVAGMLATFSGMAAAGRSAPIDTISSGISTALVTTQAGLVIAIPAAFLLALIRRQAEITHLEMQRQLHEELGKNSAAI
jgi:biopolymer transport protein ExbB